MASKVIKYKGVPKGLLLVDDDDAELLDHAYYFDFCNRWRATASNEYFRIKRCATKAERLTGSTRHIKIHNEVWEKHNGPIPEGYEVDHLDHNTLNNQKSNLNLILGVKNSSRIRKKFVPIFIENETV